MSHRHRFRSSLPLVAVLALAFASAAAAQIEEPRIPLRTALAEINTLRTEYAEAYNAKNSDAITAMYLPDATLVVADGSVLRGIDAIGAYLAEGAPNWPHHVIKSDTVRVHGNTAWDIGTSLLHPEGGGEIMARYLAVLRRDMNGWKIAALALVPVTEGDDME